MGILIIAVIVLAGLGAFIIVQREKKEAIKIGAILPLAGPGEWIGQEAGDGMLLAAKQINARNGINGRKIKLIIEDCQTDPQKAKSAFSKTENTHHPLFYVSAMSLISRAVAPLSEENSVVLFGLMATMPILTEKPKWVFRYCHTQEAVVRSILSILKELNIKNLGFIYINDKPAVSIFETVKKDFQETGGAIKGEIVKATDLDYGNQIKKLKDMEAICFIGFVAHIQEVFKQLREANYKGFIITGASGSDPTVVSMPEANRVYISAPRIYDQNYLFAKDAKEKYETEYRKPFNMFAAAGYDFMTFIAGLRQDKEISRDNVRVLLEEGFIYPGVFGVLDVKPKEHEIYFPLYPAQIINGEVKYLTASR
jgi:branched-chain amino acid transport system substrate-binding protein